jgi:hypothetical protein
LATAIYVREIKNGKALSTRCGRSHLLRALLYFPTYFTIFLWDRWKCSPPPHHKNE